MDQIWQTVKRNTIGKNRLWWDSWDSIGDRGSMRTRHQGTPPGLPALCQRRCESVVGCDCATMRPAICPTVGLRLFAIMIPEHQHVVGHFQYKHLLTLSSRLTHLAQILWACIASHRLRPANYSTRIERIFVRQQREMMVVIVGVSGFA